MQKTSIREDRDIERRPTRDLVGEGNMGKLRFKVELQSNKWIAIELFGMDKARGIIDANIEANVWRNDKGFV